MKIIVGPNSTGKSTILLHYVYNEIEKLVNAHQSLTGNQAAANGTAVKNESQEIPHACIITSKKRMNESQMMFGIYCEVQIETLRQIKLKYVEDYESLV